MWQAKHGLLSFCTEKAQSYCIEMVTLQLASLGYLRAKHRMRGINAFRE